MADDDDRDLQYKTPEWCQTVGSLDAYSTKDSGKIEVIVVHGGKTKKMVFGDFHNLMDSRIGQYVLCANNVYTYRDIVLCVGGTLYTEDFVYGLDALGSRVPQKWVFRDSKGIKVTHIKLPDYRDCVPQFDPSLPYGVVEKEGVSEQFVDQFDDYSEVPFLDKNAPLSINAGNYVLQHKTIVTPKIKPTISALKNQVVTLNVKYDSSNNPDSSNYRKICIVRANYKYHGFYDGGDDKDEVVWVSGRNHPNFGTSGRNTYLQVAGYNGFEDIFSDGDGTSMTSGERHYLLALSKASGTTVPIKTYGASNIDLPIRRIAEYRGVNKAKIMVGAKTREQTFNSVMGIYTGQLKPGELKRFWMVDKGGNSYQDDSDEGAGIFLIKSSSREDEYVGQNLEIMKGTEPLTMAPQFTLDQFNNSYEKYRLGWNTVDSGDDCIGLIEGISSTVRNEPLKVSDYFEDNYLVIQNSDGYSEGMVVSSSADGRGLQIGGVGKQTKMMLTPVYKFEGTETPTRFSVQAECTSFKIVKNGEADIVIQCPKITIEWWVVGKTVSLLLAYQFNGANNTTTWVDASWDVQADVIDIKRDRLLWTFIRPIDSIFWRVCLAMAGNESHVANIKALSLEFPTNGLINEYTTDLKNKNYIFYMKFKKELINTDYENMLNAQQKELAEDFRKSVFLNDSSNDSRYDEVRDADADNPTKITDFLKDGQYFLLGGKKVKFYYDMKGERFIGFSAVVEDGGTDKGEAICFSHYSAPIVIDDLQLVFKKREGEIADTPKNVRAIKIPFHRSSKLSLLYKDENNDIQWDSVVGNTEDKVDIYVVMSKSVMMFCLPGYDVSKIRETLDAWTAGDAVPAGKRMNKAKALEIAGNHPYFLTNTDNRDTVTGSKLSEGLTGYAFPGWLRFYVRMK